MKSLSRALLMGIFCWAVAGCNSGPDLDDAAERGIYINGLLKKSEELLTSVRADIQESQRENSAIDLDQGIKKLTIAGDSLRKAMELSPESYTPRVNLAHALHLTGMLYLMQRELIGEDILEYRDSGRTEPAPLLAKRNAADKSMTRFFTQSNQELDFYVRYLMKKYPLEGVYLLQAENFRYMEKWGSAAQALRDHVEFWSERLIKEDRLRNYQVYIRKYEDLELRAEDLRQANEAPQ